MNLIDANDFFSTILPIIIFIIFMIASAFGSKRKLPQGSKGQPNQYQQPSDSSNDRRYSDYESEEEEYDNEPIQAQGEKRGGFEDVKQTIEDMLNEMGLPKEEPSHYEKQPVETYSQTNKNVESFETLKPVSSKNAEIESGIYSSAITQKVKSIAEIDTLEQEKEEQISVDIDQVRLGIIWSEILQKPVALRQGEEVSAERV